MTSSFKTQAANIQIAHRSVLPNIYKKKTLFLFTGTKDDNITVSR